MNLADIAKMEEIRKQFGHPEPKRQASPTCCQPARASGVSVPEEPEAAEQEKKYVPVNSAEMRGLKWGIAALQVLATEGEALDDRLDMVHFGRRRWKMMIGSLQSVLRDMCATAPIRQQKQIKNTFTDMNMQLVPKFTPLSGRCVIDVRDLAYIVYAAKKDICLGCVRDAEERKGCDLHQILASLMPPDDWHDDLKCPYEGDYLDKVFSREE